jgi:hypothetical protein
MKYFFSPELENHLKELEKNVKRLEVIPFHCHNMAKK